MIFFVKKGLIILEFRYILLVEIPTRWEFIKYEKLNTTIHYHSNKRHSTGCLLLRLGVSCGKMGLYSEMCVRGFCVVFLICVVYDVVCDFICYRVERVS